MISVCMAVPDYHIGHSVYAELSLIEIDNEGVLKVDCTILKNNYRYALSMMSKSYGYIVKYLIQK